MSLLALLLFLSPTISDTPDPSLDPTPLPELCKCKPGHPAHRVGRDFATICCPYKPGPCPWESPCLAGCNEDYECNDEPYDPSGLPTIAKLHEADGFPCTVESDGETMLGSCGTSTIILYTWECFIDENAHGTCYDNLGYEWGTLAVTNFADLSVAGGCKKPEPYDNLSGYGCNISCDGYSGICRGTDYGMSCSAYVNGKLKSTWHTDANVCG